MSFCFGLRPPKAVSALRDFNARGRQSRPCAKVFTCGENACTAHSRRRPEGRVGAVLSACREFENIQIVVTSQKKRTSERMSFCFEFRSRPKGGSTLRDLNAQVGKAALPPRFSLSAKMLERRKSGAAQKGCWVIFKIADENLMYLYCHALLKRNTSRQAGVSFWTPLGFKLLIGINSRCSAVRKSTPTQQSAR